MATHAKGVLDAILGAQDFETTQKAALQVAQSSLVNAICTTCWTGDRVTWVHCYVQPNERLIGGTTKEDWYLHRASALSGITPEELSRLFDASDAAWKSLPKAKQMSHILAQEGAPVHTITMKNATLCVEPSINSQMAPEYAVLFQGRQTGAYVHVDCPCRTTQLPERQGGLAGAYLFIKDASEVNNIPACLIGALRSFVQALVVAQTWMLVTRQQEELRQASLPFVAYRGHLQSFMDAANRLANMVDPLEFGSDPEETRLADRFQVLLRAQLFLSDRVFVSTAEALVWHDCAPTRSADKERFLALVKQGEIPGIEENTSADDAWRIAHNLYKCRYSLSERVFGPAGDPDLSDPIIRSRLLRSAVQLEDFAANGPYAVSISEETLLILRKNGNNWTNSDGLKAAIVEWMTGSRRSLGGNTSRPLARLLLPLAQLNRRDPVGDAITVANSQITVAVKEITS